MRSSVFAATFGLALIAGAGSSHANIVTNGGFETDPSVVMTPPGFVQYGNVFNTGISIGAAHSGTAAYDFGGSESLGFNILSQDLPTVAGKPYELNFYLFVPGGSPTEFLVNVGGDASSGTVVGGQTLIDLVDPPTTEADPSDFLAGYSLRTAFFTATSTSTNLNFAAYNNPNFFLLDDISVNAVPLPAGLPMFGAAVLALGAIGYGAKRKAQSFPQS